LLQSFENIVSHWVPLRSFIDIMDLVFEHDAVDSRIKSYLQFDCKEKR